MKAAKPTMRDFAELLIAHEGKMNGSSRREHSAVCPVIDQIQPHLTTLMGTTGFRTLLARALALASAEVPQLRVLQVNAGGALIKVDTAETDVDAKQIEEGGVALLSCLLGLLGEFIGEILTLQLVDEVWPDLPSGNLS